MDCKSTTSKKTESGCSQTDPQFEDVTALKSVLNQERNLRRDAEKTVTDLKVQFEGVNAEEYRKLQDRVKGLDDADVYDKQGIESLVARRTEAMKAEHERQVASKDREIHPVARPGDRV